MSPWVLVLWSWSITKAAKWETIQKAKTLKAEKRIATYPDFVTGQTLSQEVLLSVIFTDDEFSR